MPSYIDNSAQGANGIGPVDDIAPLGGGVLHNAAGHHDDILGRLGQLFDDQVDHLTERGIFVLEQLADAKEERRGLVGGELFPCVEQQGNLGEEDTAFPRRDGGAVEDSGCSSMESAYGAAHGHWEWDS